MNNIYKIISVFSAVILLNGCQTTDIENFFGKFEPREVPISENYYENGDYYRDAVKKTQVNDIDINEIASSAVTIYDLDDKQVINDYADDRINNGLELLPPNFHQGSIKSDNAVTIYGFDDNEVANIAVEYKSEEPSLLPPVENGSKMFLSPFKNDGALKQPSNLLTK